MGSAVSVGGTEGSLYEVVDFSANLRAKLENAESTLKKTRIIEEALKAEEVEETEIEIEETEDEMKIARILGM